jgi:hypothetical protein
MKQVRGFNEPRRGQYRSDVINRYQKIQYQTILSSKNEEEKQFDNDKEIAEI